MEVEIFINKTVEQNAVAHYDASKKAKKKLKGALATIERFKHQIEDLPVPKQVRKEVRKLFWFEKFRWFITSTGFLAIGGRDATTNEVIIKKYTDPLDLVFHTDMAGSPFFVIKAENKVIDPQSMQEVADAVCSFSRAWKLNLTTQSVFYVKPEQVTKQAKAGEYLTKGAFMINGKTNYIDNKINLAIGKISSGEYINVIMCAPLEAIQVHCKTFIKLKQGETKPSDMAKALKKQLGSSVDEIIRILPPGNVDIPKR